MKQPKQSGAQADSLNNWPEKGTKKLADSISNIEQWEEGLRT